MDEFKKLIEEIRATFVAFQKANDERVAKVEAGLITAQSSDKIEALNGHITHLQGKYDELVKQMVNLEVGGGSGSHKVDREKLSVHAKQFYAGIHGQTMEELKPEQVDAYAAYCKAFPKWVLRGEKALNDPDIYAAMQVGSDPDGGYWVPTERMGEMITKLYDTSEMRAIADVEGITGDSFPIDLDLEEAETEGFVGETHAPSETGTPKLGNQVIYVRQQVAEPRITQKLLDMSTRDTEAWLMGKLNEKFSRVENNRFVAGAGVVNPRGFLDYAAAAVTTADAARAWGKLQYVFTGQSAGFPTVSGLPGASDADCLIDITTALRPAFRPGAVWVMNRLTEAVLRKLKDAEGRYLITGGLEGAFTGFQLGGFPIRHFEDMPVIGANSFSAAFGNFRVGYKIVDGRGMRVLRDPFTAKPYVKFYTTKWTGGDVKHFEAIKLLKFGTS